MREGERSNRKSQSAVDAKIRASAELAFIVGPENAFSDGSKIQMPSRSAPVAPVTKLARAGMARTDLGAASWTGRCEGAMEARTYHTAHTLRSEVGRLAGPGRKPQRTCRSTCKPAVK